MYTLGDFERITILKTTFFNIDRNFLHLDDLKEIAYTAYELEVKNFPKYDLDDLYYDDSRIDLVYNNYKKFILDEYEKIKNSLMED